MNAARQNSQLSPPRWCAQPHARKFLELNMSAKHLDYRGDIQIYRAIAVLQVILFHMGAPGFAAGFLGVDIFFVISGYLMAKLYTEKSTPKDFYLRRARRLMPAYFAVIGLTLLVSFWVTVPTDFSQVAEQATFASLISSNIGFFLQNSYFSKTEFNPLLHLWSLGVECQFYLFFPFIMILSRKSKLVIPVLIGVTLLACFTFIFVSPKISFFLTPLRLWEFGVGIWAAGKVRNRSDSTIIGTIGLIGILFIPLLPIQGEHKSLTLGHPGLAALLVSIATATALIYRLPMALVRSRLGKGAQSLGNVSYSLYLVHWPALVLYHYVPFGGTLPDVSSFKDFILSTAIIVLATSALYITFERKGPVIFTPVRASVVAACTVMVCQFLPTLQLSRFDDEDVRIFTARLDRAPYRCGKIARVLHPTEKMCRIGSGVRGTVLLVGDSHSDAIKQTFASTASHYGLATDFAVDNNPLITPGLDDHWLLDEAKARRASAIFIHFASHNMSNSVIEKARSAASLADIPLYIILPTPEYNEHVPQKMYEAKRGGASQPYQDINTYNRRNSEIINYVNNKSLIVLNPSPFFCHATCKLVDDSGNLLYFDSGHLTLHGANVLRPLLSSALKVVADRTFAPPSSKGQDALIPSSR